MIKNVEIKKYSTSTTDIFETDKFTIFYLPRQMMPRINFLLVRKASEKHYLTEGVVWIFLFHTVWTIGWLKVSFGCNCRLNVRSRSYLITFCKVLQSNFQAAFVQFWVFWLLFAIFCAPPVTEVLIVIPSRSFLFFVPLQNFN